MIFPQKKTISQLEMICHRMRVNLIEMAYRSGKNSAHCGGSLSSIEILATLYHNFWHFDPADPETRDRIVISKAHASLAQYCALESIGLLSESDLRSFEQNGSHYTVHAKKDISRGIEFSGGSLGLGLSYSVGVAYALKAKGRPSMVYVLLGDGECDEGIVWESLMFARHHHLDNLTVIVDHNHLQADGFIEDILDTSDLSEKFKAFGFRTSCVDGHSIQALIDALASPSDGQPKAIIAETVKGKGISFMENKYSWHFTVLPDGKYKQALAELNDEKNESC